MGTTWGQLGHFWQKAKPANPLFARIYINEVLTVQADFKLFDDASNALIYCVSRLLTVSPTHHLSSDINDSKPLLFCEGLHALLHRITLLAQSTYNIRFADFKAYKSRRGKNFQSKEKTRKNRPNLKKTLGTTWGHLELQDLQFPTNVANFFAY